MKRPIPFHLAVLLAFGFVNATARARGQVTIYDTLGPLNAYNSLSFTVGGWRPGFDNPPEFWWSAEAFTPVISRPMQVGQITIALSAGDAALADLYLLEDAGGVPGSVVERYGFETLPHGIPTSDPPTTVESLLHPTLLPGRRYWVAVTTHGPEWSPNTGDKNAVAWYDALPDPGGALAALSHDGTTWTLFSGESVRAVRIAGVPEPGATAFVLSAVFVGAGFRLLVKPRLREQAGVPRRRPA